MVRLGRSSKRLGKETEETGNQRKNRKHPDHSIVKSDKNTQKIPRDLKRLAITQNSVKKNKTTIDDCVKKTHKKSRKQKWEEKQLYGRFKRLISDISHEKTWTWLRKENLERETESPTIAAQSNAVRTNHIKARIDKTQQNCRCRL